MLTAAAATSIIPAAWERKEEDGGRKRHAAAIIASEFGCSFTPQLLLQPAGRQQTRKGGFVLKATPPPHTIPRAVREDREVVGGGQRAG